MPMVRTRRSPFRRPSLLLLFVVGAFAQSAHADTASVGMPAGASLDPERQALLATWEERLREDPHTTTLEPSGPGRYRFATSRFPYEGELVVLNAAIEPMPGWGEGTARMGVVEVELPDLDPRFFERHAQSYGFWAQGNLLYDDGSGWMSQDEWSAKIQEELPTGCFGILRFLDWTWIVFLVGLFALVLLATRRASRQVKQSLSAQDEALAQQRLAMEQQRLSIERQAHAIQLTEQSLALVARQTEMLGEILEELRKRA